ncbi:hypothetical protein [Rudaea sp.]|uniref:hypothetical protein n=1 Tax=Rudaea sp. TaxID=2136325 RepID=UPI003220529D
MKALMKLIFPMLLSPVSLSYAQALQTIVFSPPNPTAGQPIEASLPDYQVCIDYEPLYYGAQIVITPVGYGSACHPAVQWIGPLSAGTYQVTWAAPVHGGGSPPVGAGTLVVSAIPVAAPTLSINAMVLLTGFFCALAAGMLKQQRSKRF